MDPLTLIVTALGSLASSGGQSFISEAAKDAYTALKTRVQQKFTGNPAAELALQEHETNPGTWELPLKQALREAQVDQDKDIIDAAEKVMTLVQPQQAAMGKYNVQITGNVQGFAQGDHQRVDMHFGIDPEEKK